MASPMLKPEPTKTRPKKTAPKNPNQKKPRMRGLGVAQLEQLRLQERWDKLTEMPPPLPPHHFQFQPPPNFPALHHFPSAPPPVVVTDSTGGGGGVFAFDHQGLVLQRLGNGGFIAGGPGGLMYPHGVGPADPRLLIGNSVEASRELSSIPKFPPPPPPCGSDRRDICFKKKRANFNNVVKDQNTLPDGETPPSYDFLGLNTNSAAHGGGTPPNQYTDFGYTFNFNQGGAEVKQIHRKAAGSGGGEGKSILMEYEFFPSKNGRGSEFEELEMPKEEILVNSLELEEIGVMDHGEGSCITTNFTDIINGGISSSSALDLSLKLSF